MSAALQPECLLEVNHVRKAFPGVVALEDVSLRFNCGTVHALAGENGAGKSTLMKIIAGLYRPDAGELRWRGQPLRLSSPRHALETGIAIIHQELNLMSCMSVAENIWIGREPRNRIRLISHRALHRQTRDLLARLHLDLDPGAELRTLSIAGRQLVEIANALSYESQLLIMDEPTSALSEHDTEHLFAIVRELKNQGKSIVYITHRMDELFAIADEVSVMRDGKHVGTDRPANLTRNQIIRMMVGRELSQFFPAPPVTSGAVVLSAQRLTLRPHFHDVSFELRAGEILGVAGLIGAGRSKLAETLFGLARATSGRIEIGGRTARIDSPHAALSRGMAFVTEDRKETGCFLKLSVLENLEVALLSRAFVEYGFVRKSAITRACAAIAQLLRVKTPNLQVPIEQLSGGNQ